MVEIRELVIQARLREEDGPGTGDTRSAQSVNTDETPELQVADPDPKWIQKIVEICLREMQERWTEKSMR
jgi:hypothetical protein